MRLQAIPAGIDQFGALARLPVLGWLRAGNSIPHFLAGVVRSLLVAVTLAWLQIRRRAAKESSKARGSAWIEIDLARLRHNVREIRRVLPAGCELVAVVKAEAYGHGAAECARELSRLGVHALAVAKAQEGIRLRRQGIKGDILVLGYTHPDELPELIRCNLIQTVVDAEYAQLLSGLGRRIRVHVKIDTGMHRLGEEYDHLERIRQIYACPHLAIEGIYTHLCVSDSLAEPDVAFTREQIRRFDGVVQAIRRLGHEPGKIHIQSSYGLLNYPDLACDWARIGLALYGVLSGSEDRTKVSLDLQPVLSFRARIAEVRQIAPGESVGYGRLYTAGDGARVAVVAAGYADGIPRNLSCGRGHVLVHGRRVSIVGRVCMDQMMIDVSAVPGALQGDTVTFIGQDGAERIAAEEVAAWAGTISNELLSRLGGRLQRFYVDGLAK